MVKVGRHVIGGLDAPDAADVLVRSPVAHYADGFHRREEDDERLTYGPVTVSLVELLDHDGVSLLERRAVLRIDLAKDSDGEAGTREGVTPDAVLLDAKGDAELSHLVLEKLPQGLDELELHGRGQTANVVVSLYGGGRPLVGDALDDVGVQRALQQEVAGMAELSLDLVSLLLEHIDEGGANDFPLLLRIGHPLEQAEEPIGRVHALEVDPAVPPEALQHRLCLVLAEAAVVHQDGVEAVSYGLLHEDGGDGRVDPPADGPDDVTGWPHLLPHLLDELLGIVRHDPVLLGPGDAYDEVAQHVLPALGVRHLGMELQAPHPLVQVLHGDELGVLGSRHVPEALGQLVQLVPVRHPHGEGVRQALEQGAVAPLAPGHRGLAVLPLLARRYSAPEGLGYLLHAVADAQHGDPPFLDQVPDALGDVRRPLLVHRRRTPAKDDGGELVRCQLGGIDQARVQLAVHVQFADPPRDQVRVLRSEVQDGHLGPPQVAQLGGLLEHLGGGF